MWNQFIHQVSKSDEEGERMARIWGCQYVETSAKKNEKIDEVFETIIADIHTNRIARMNWNELSYL